MNARTMVTALALALGTIGVASVANAERTVDIEVGVAPPPARIETVPAPREGYIYDQGHYEWDGQRYIWIDGRYIERREGHEWRPSVVEHHGDKWRFRAGHWDDDD